MNNNKIKKLIMLTTTALLLTACGSKEVVEDEKQSTEVLADDKIEETTKAPEASFSKEKPEDVESTQESTEEEIQQSMEELSEVFMPASFVEEQTKKDKFESYDEIIGYLSKGQGYQYIELTGYEGKLLIITSGVYDNGDGNMASIEGYIYGKKGDSVKNVGNIFSDGTAYPLRTANNLVYGAGNHSVESCFVCEDTFGLMVKDNVMETFNEDGKASYIGFLREKNDFVSPEENIETESDAIFKEKFKEYNAAEIINFNVIE